MKSNFLPKEYKKRILPVWISGNLKQKREYEKELVKKRKYQHSLEMKKKNKQEAKKLNKLSPLLDKHPKFYTCSQLKDHCRLRGLSVSGLKVDLIIRVIYYEETNNFVNWSSERKRREKIHENIRKSLNIKNAEVGY